MIKYLVVSSLLVLTNIAMKRDPISIANLFEGDIAGLTSRDIEILHGEAKEKKVFFRNGIIQKENLWLNHEIPYIIVGKFKRHFLITISKAMKEFQKKTCIR